MKRLNYAPIELGNEDVKTLEFENIDALRDGIDHLCHGKNKNIVYLFGTEGMDEYESIFVTISYLQIEELLNEHKRIKTWNNFFLHEYESYEDAYSVALSMREDSEICYSKENNYINPSLN